MLEAMTESSVCTRACVEAETVSAGGGATFRVLSGSYQKRNGQLPLLSYQCEVNCLPQGEKNRVPAATFFIFYTLNYSTVQHLRCNCLHTPAIHHSHASLIYLNNANKWT